MEISLKMSSQFCLEMSRKCHLKRQYPFKYEMAFKII